MKKTIKITDLEAIVKQAHEKVKNLKGGKNADYPALAKIDLTFSVSLSVYPEKSSKPEIQPMFSVSNLFLKSPYSCIDTQTIWSRKSRIEKDERRCLGLPFNSIMAILLERIIRVPPWSMPALSVPIVWLSPS